MVASVSRIVWRSALSAGFHLRIVSGGTTATRYLHQDHLGSFLALPIHALPRHDGRGRTIGARDTITDEAGLVVQRMSFDASKQSLAPPRWASAAGSAGCHRHLRSDAHVARRSGWQGKVTTAAVAVFNTAATTRGFTGHEMIDPVG